MPLVEKDVETGEWLETGEMVFTDDETAVFYDVIAEPLYDAYYSGSYSTEEALNPELLNNNIVKAVLPAQDEEGFYLIGTPKQLVAFRAISTDVDYKVKAKLTADIDMAGVGMQPINRSDYSFRGVFDGQGHALSNVYILNNAERTGLFNTLDGATVKNLKLTGEYYSDSKYMGGIAGYTYNSRIENCDIAVTINSAVEGDGTHGGLIAYNASDGTVIENCLVNCAILGENTYSCGGVCGWAGSKMTINNTLVLSSNYTVKTNSGNTISRNPDNCTTNNVFYVTQFGDAKGTKATEEQLASGEICWTLNGETEKNVRWYQKLGTDVTPLPFVREGGKVYLRENGSYANMPDNGLFVRFSDTNMKSDTIVVGSSTMVKIELNNENTDLVAFQMDLTLPEGVSIDKDGCSLSSRITDEEQELTIGKLENGAYRLTSSSLSLTPISGNDGTLLTLKLTAESGSVGGQATIGNIRFSTSESERVTMNDETFDVNVMYKVIYKVDGEEYKTVNVLYNTPVAPETGLIKEGYTFSGWSEIPETMPAHNVEVTGNFTINKYKLTYMVDGVEYKSCEIDYATTITPEVGPTKEGYTFSGWSEIPETMPARDVEVTGAFTINSYTLTYLVDGEEYKTSSVVYGTELTLEAEPTKHGYTFGGWSELPETMPARNVEVTGQFYLYGDVNTDEEVDVVDVVDVARFVVATPSEKFREKLADLNFDNTVNIGDAVVLVNHIAGDQNFVKELFAPEHRIDTGVLSLSRNGRNLALNLTNGQAYTAFQFDLYVAEDADVVKMMLNGQRQQKHQLLYNKIEDGHYRVAVLSTSNSTFLGKAGELLSLVIDDALDADVEISNIHFFDAKGNDYVFDTIGVDQETGVNNVNGNNNVNDNIYDLQGRTLSKLQGGVNVIGGKKVLVK